MHIRRIPRRADGIADQPGSSGELERVPIDYLRKQRRAAEEQKIILSVTTRCKEGVGIRGDRPHSFNWLSQRSCVSTALQISTNIPV